MSIKISRIRPLLRLLLKVCTCAEGRELIYKIKAAIMAEIDAIQPMITGWNKLIFCFMETIVIAAIVATKVAIIHGIKISMGFVECAAALSAIILTGISVSPEACRQRNITCASLARSLSGFNSCRLSIALNPNGVAALSNPKRLAEKFIIMCPIAGCPFGMPGNILEKKGPMILESKLIPPAFSAIAIKPRNKAIIPIRPKLRLTATLQVSITPSAVCIRKLWTPVLVFL